jgi:hypothetical protein
VKLFSRIFLSSIVIVLLSSNFLLGVEQGSIKEINSFKQLEKEFSAADKQTVMVFDVDGVLTYSPDNEFLFNFYDPKVDGEEHAAFVEKAKSLYNEYMSGKNDYERTVILRTTTDDTKPNFLVEAGVVEYINKMKKKGVRIFALTAWPSGSFGQIRSGRELRFKTLKNLGIDFSPTFKVNEFCFGVRKPYSPDNTAMLYKGIVCSGWLNEKGEVLKALLMNGKKLLGDNTWDYSKAKVMYCDDSKKQVENVTQWMVKEGVSCTGYWYRALEDVKKFPRPKFDRNAAAIQLNYLLEHNALLGITEAKSRAKKECLQYEQRIIPLIR